MLFIGVVCHQRKVNIQTSDLSITTYNSVKRCVAGVILKKTDLHETELEYRYLLGQFGEHQICEVPSKLIFCHLTSEHSKQIILSPPNPKAAVMLSATIQHLSHARLRITIPTQSQSEPIPIHKTAVAVSYQQPFSVRPMFASVLIPSHPVPV